RVMALVQAVFATSWVEFLKTVPGAIAIYAITIAWVLRADEAFGAITDEITETQANRPTQKRATYQARQVGWTLASTGRDETPFVWKGALQTFRFVDPRVLIRIATL